ncbi:MAG: hypothetical protein ABTQ34_03135 [Bdellovibrionales bacterium]
MRGIITVRRKAEQGIAIGPILFIIAILGILASAIAAGSGSFTASTSSEGAKTKAAALIQVGENLKIGMDRLVIENSIAWGDYTIDTTKTANVNDLFSPAGGGIASPSPSLSNDPANGDNWNYPTGDVPGFGSTNDDQIVVLPVSEVVCTEVNNKANGYSNEPSINVTAAALQVNTAIADLSGWPAALQGKPIGCLQSSDSKFFFYQILYIQ